MGNNQASHKHLRADSLKPNTNPVSASNLANTTAGATSGASGGGGNLAAGGFVYPSEDLAEEFDDTVYTRQFSKNSYVSTNSTVFIQLSSSHYLLLFYHFKSPSDSVPTFRFPSRSESIKISSNNQAQLDYGHSKSLQMKKIPVVFKYTGKNAKDVLLVGSFTNWKDKIPMVKSDGDYIAIVDLPEGEHQYKFVVDNKWEHDPSQVYAL